MHDTDPPGVGPGVIDFFDHVMAHVSGHVNVTYYRIDIRSQSQAAGSRHSQAHTTVLL